MRYVVNSIAAICLGTGSLSAQETEISSADAYVAFWEGLAREAGALPAASRSSPSPIGVASGFGLGRGTLVFGGAATNARERGSAGSFDGSFAIAAGFGSPRTGVGFEIVVGSTSTGDPRDGISGVLGDGGVFAEGNLSFKLSRELTPAPFGQTFSVSFGAANALSWGTPSEVDTNYFLAATSLFDLQITDGPAYPVNVTLGLGSAVSNLERDPGVFFGIGVGLTERLSASASWMGDEVIVGASLSPWDSGRFQISLAAGDVTQRVSEGRVILAIGYVWDGMY
jgi:hypothetical protein